MNIGHVADSVLLDRNSNLELDCYLKNSIHSNNNFKNTHDNQF